MVRASGRIFDAAARRATNEKCGLAALAAGPAGARWGFSNAVEIITFGAVGPVLTFGGAKFLGPDLGHRLAGIRRVRHIALGHAVGRLPLLRHLKRAGRRVLFHFQEGVLIQHLPHFLVQFQCGELQQADGLLQLGRQRQVLRKPYLK